MTAIFWHQVDLRLPWNHLLSMALKENKILVPVYIYTPSLEKMGRASQWFLHESLKALGKEYEEKGSRLILKQGDPLKILEDLIEKTSAKTLYWNTRFEPIQFKAEEKVRKALEKKGIDVKTSNGNHLIDPREIFSGSGKPYTVFTPFYNAVVKQLSLPPTPKLPSHFPPCPTVNSATLESFALIPHNQWFHKLEHYWKGGRKEGLKRLKTFTASSLKFYGTQRDFPGIKGTSTLSPYLHFGALSPHEVWIATEKNEHFHKQLIWREFATYFLFHFPEAQKENWKQAFDSFAWENRKGDLKKWTTGMTGYPIVDAGMRQLWETGWMHNRVRMIVASFLIKDLFIDWREGEKWFWDTLVDADKGNNVLGWQWVAGSGPDASPFFRIFNPILQGKKFDKEGTYIRTFIPELKNLPQKWIHHPWDAPQEVLEKAGIILGKTYPKPLVNHDERRKIALKKFHNLKKKL